MARFEDLVGRRFGRLVVKERAENILHANGRRRVAWVCLCDCGNDCVVETYHLKSGSTKSCGCLRSEVTTARYTTHNGSKERLYKVWMDMKQRCYNPNYKQYHDYGGRGIRVCDEWKNDYLAFREFAMRNGYDPEAKFGETTIDRVDVNGDYSPQNCRFVNMKVQNQNKRRRKNERF